MLNVGFVVPLFHSCSPQYIHLMVCKPKAFARNLAKFCRTKQVCRSTTWLAYGSDDVTTVPLEFGCPILEGSPWSPPSTTVAEEGAYTHVTAALQAFLCFLSVSSGRTLGECLHYIRVPNHSSKRVSLYGVFVVPECALSDQISRIFPHCSKLIPVLNQIGVCVEKYEWWLRQLESTDMSEFNFE